MSLRSGSICIFMLLLCACGGVSHNARCERGGYQDSVSICQALAGATAVPAEQARFRALAARDSMWSCRRLDSPACATALGELWLWSSDPADVRTAVRMSQDACEAGVAAGCVLASRAAWYGRGVELDALASLSWHACEGCAAWDATTITFPAPLDQTGAAWTPIDVTTRLDRVRVLAAAGAHAQATVAIAADLAAGALLGHETEVQALLAASARARWQLEVDPLLASGHPLRALAVAEALVALAPSETDLTVGRDRIRAELAATAAERSSEATARGLPLAAAFHATRASQLGAVIAVPTVDLAAMWIDLPVRPQFVLPASCEWLRPALEGAYPSAPSPNVTITATMTCVSTEQLTTEEQPYTWYETIEETREVATSEQLNCPAPPACTYVNGNSVCNYDTGLVPCGSTNTGTSTVVEKTYVPHEGMRTVTGRHLVISFEGTLATPSHYTPATFNRVIDDAASIDNAGVHDFPGTPTIDVVAEAMAAARAAVQPLITAAYLAQANLEVAAAAAATDPLVAEEHLLRAQSLGSPSEALAATYDLTVAQLVAVMSTGVLGLPEVVMPAFAGVAARPQAPQAYALSHYPGEPTGAIESKEAESHRSNQGLARIAMGTELTLERTSRGGAMPASGGFGARIERGWKLRRPFGLAPGFSLAGATDDVHGSSFDLRAGGAIGLRTENHQLVYTIGVGAGGLGIPGAGPTSTLTSAVDFFHGADLRLGFGPLALEGRLWQVRGGPLGSETRASAQLLFQLDWWLVGAETSIRDFDTEAGDRITSFGVVLGFGTPRLR